MADLPYMKFFTGDWIRDTRFLSVEAKGAWVDTLAALWDSRTRGLLSHPVGGWARLWGCSESQADQIIDALSEVAEIVREQDGVLIVSRRMVRDEIERERERNKKRQQKGQKASWSFSRLILRRVPSLSRLVPGEFPEDSPDFPGDFPSGSPPIPESRVQSPNPEKREPNGSCRIPSDPASDSPVSAKPNEPKLETVWQAYPERGRRRSSRKKMADAWARIPAKERIPVGYLLASLEAWKATEDWQKQDGEFVPAVDRWIRDRKWADPPEPTTTNPTEADFLGGRRAHITKASDLVDEQNLKLESPDEPTL